MTTTPHMDTPASSLAETGDHQCAPCRGLLMRGRKALAAPWLLAMSLSGAVGACGRSILLTVLVYFYFSTPSVAWLGQLPFSHECPQYTQQPSSECLIVGERIVISRIAKNVSSCFFRIFIDNIEKLKFRSTCILVGGYPDENGITILIRDDNVYLYFRCDSVCGARLSKPLGNGD